MDRKVTSEAETLLGKALREIPRDRYTLATKVARHGSTEAEFDFSAKGVKADVDQSLRRLGVDYVDFIQVHDMEFGSIQQIIEETIPALREVQAAGKALFVGITCLPLKLFKQVIAQVAVDQIQSYCHYCLSDTSLEDLLPYLQEKGVAIFNSAPLSMRLLSNEGPPEWHPAPAELKARCREAAALCQARGTELGRLALRYAIENPLIHTHIVGTADSRRVRENIVDAKAPLDQELLRDVLRILKPVQNMTWSSGRPENN